MGGQRAVLVATEGGCELLTLELLEENSFEKARGAIVCIGWMVRWMWMDVVRTGDRHRDRGLRAWVRGKVCSRDLSADDQALCSKPELGMWRFLWTVTPMGLGRQSVTGRRGKCKVQGNGTVAPLHRAL